MNLKRIKIFCSRYGFKRWNMFKVFQNRGCKVLGIDPAKNAVEIALKKGIPTILDFLTNLVLKKYNMIL